MFAVERHAKLHEVKNMDGNFNPNKLCEKDFSSYPQLSSITKVTHVYDEC